MKRLVFMLLALWNFKTVHAQSLADNTYRNWVSERGEISLPKNYRATWAHLGSWLIADSDAPGHGFHDIYTQPEVVSIFHHTGEFPDGAILIKEVRSIQEAYKTTGLAQWAGDISILFVMVKDQRGRFQNNLHWQQSWGWALFNFDDNQLSKNVSGGFEQSCRGCHWPARTQDWVFTEGYPTLTNLTH